ncbi:hypothetical protein IFM89_015674 [Coptis chinensis]|uniref:Uncharacterized protein n=1 Tax=Coptis chinensis TaxID=261450 RepID=A0A835I3F2_9MAGN|nr:hypothetical protein IFM89_015674 [Coptis chinensis]
MSHMARQCPKCEYAQNLDINFLGVFFDVVMVYLLGRAGYLEEGLNLAAMMPTEACVEHCLVLVGSIEILIREKGVRKKLGCSLMEAKDGIIHDLFAGDITHPKSKEFKEALDDLLQTSF